MALCGIKAILSLCFFTWTVVAFYVLYGLPVCSLLSQNLHMEVRGMKKLLQVILSYVKGKENTIQNNTTTKILY